MNLRKRFVVSFVFFILIVVITVSLISIAFLQNTFEQFANAPNKELISVMAKKMLTKSIVSFSLLILFILGLSIFMGIFFFKLISASYLRIFGEFTSIAQKRLKTDKKNEIGENERIILEKYLKMLFEDQQKIRDFEKIKSWKDGARLLIHEIKNPLTPLKLSAQSLMITSEDPEIIDEINSISNSVSDIEEILTIFKELVNIDFGPIQTLDLKLFLDNYFENMQKHKNETTKTESFQSEIIHVNSESSLLKLLFNNLINNGIEANPKGFAINVTEKEQIVVMKFVTKNRRIETPEIIFNFGVSQKGTGRGYGLFLCKMISDYLDLNLKVENINDDVVFEICIKKMERDDE